VTASTETTPAGQDGGTIDPSGIIGAVRRICDVHDNPKEGYVVADVTLNGNSMGPLTTFSEDPVAFHNVVAKFAGAGGVGRRYDNDGDDQARAVAAYAPPGRIRDGIQHGPHHRARCFTIGMAAGRPNLDRQVRRPRPPRGFREPVAADAAGNIYVAGYGYRGQVVKHLTSPPQVRPLGPASLGRPVRRPAERQRRNQAMAVDAQGFVSRHGTQRGQLTKTDVKHTIITRSNTTWRPGSPVWAARYDGGPSNSVDEPAGIASTRPGTPM
jgi:hypothetical protein